MLQRNCLDFISMIGERPMVNGLDKEDTLIQNRTEEQVPFRRMGINSSIGNLCSGVSQYLLEKPGKKNCESRGDGVCLY